jgi:hypothetical protein
MNDNGIMRISFVPRDFIAALVAALVAAGGAYASYKLPTVNADVDEDTAEFRDTVAVETKTIAAMIADTKAGKNISEFRLGMFSMNLLNQLADRDPGLGAYFHRDGRMMQSYLTDVFQYHSDEEMAHVAALAGDGKRATRESARYALEALRHIPNPSATAETQAEDRTALADALTELNTNLAKAARE